MSIEDKSVETVSKSDFQPDFGVAILSAIGILGFVVGCCFLFWNKLIPFKPFNDDKHRVVFHEIKYQPRQYLDLIITYHDDSLTRVIKKRKEDLTGYTNPKLSADSVRIKKELGDKNDKDSLISVQLSTYKKYFQDFSEADTTSFAGANKVLHFQLTPDSLNKWYDLYNQSVNKNDWESPFVKYYLKDQKLPFKMDGGAVLKIQPYNSVIAFITKYPSCGIWIMLLLIFCSYCFVAIATAFHLKDKIKELSIKNLPDDYLLICFITAGIMAFMALVWRLTFYDENILQNIFFMEHFDDSLTYVIVLGTITGACCLAGFIYTASILGTFSKPLSSVRKEVDTLKTSVIDATKSGDNDIIKVQQDLLTVKQADQDKQEELFFSISKFFQQYFLLAAIILCLLVLCTGALFNTINSLDFVKLLADDWGYSPVRNDFIYLYGGLYTIILLLVYIPAKMRFSEVDIWTKPGTTTDDNGKWSSILKNPFGQFKDVLVATSPFLVSIIQTLFDVLFK